MTGHVTAAIAAQVALLTVAACPWVTRATARRVRVVVAGWRGDRAWARGLRADHDQHWAACEALYDRSTA